MYAQNFIFSSYTFIYIKFCAYTCSHFRLLPSFSTAMGRRGVFQHKMTSPIGFFRGIFRSFSCCFSPCHFYAEKQAIFRSESACFCLRIALFSCRFRTCQKQADSDPFLTEFQPIFEQNSTQFSAKIVSKSSFFQPFMPAA